jgi:hypothetical protein
LVAEQNNELLLKNHQSRPTGSAPFPEEIMVKGVDVVKIINIEGDVLTIPQEEIPHLTTKRGITMKHNNNNKKGKGLLNKPPKAHDELCYRCGMEGHWSCTCRMAKHLVDLYQASKGKGKEIEMNFAGHNDPKDHMGVDITHLDVFYFFENPNRNNI